MLFWSISLAVTVTANLMVPCFSPLLLWNNHMQATGPNSCFNNPFLKSGMGFLLSRFSACNFTKKLLFMPYTSERLIQAQIT